MSKMKPVGYEKVAVGNSPTSPSKNLAGASSFVIMSVEDNAIRWRADGTDPTVTEGILMATGDHRDWENASFVLWNLKMISTSTTTAAAVRLHYFDAGNVPDIQPELYGEGQLDFSQPHQSGHVVSVGL